MSQRKVMHFLVKNPNSYFSVKQLASYLKVNVQTVYTAVKALEKTGEVLTKELEAAGRIPEKLYGYKYEDTALESVIKELAYLGKDPRFAMNQHIGRELFLIAEIRRLRETIENNK